MDLLMDYDLLRNMFLELGEEKFFNVFNKTYGDNNFFTMSTAWVDDKQYILKFKGFPKDVIIYWK